ncbi:MAG: hypothetical protein GX970_00810 [Phyllobacteriaceae bacterium]|nr:hypothetical protein [Phyllobacteriaceae bacterium]
METTSTASPERHQLIVAALTREIDRQAQTGASRIDVEALADAVDEALVPPSQIGEGKRPSELNATNDD